MKYKSIHNYTINIGKSIGIYRIYYNFNPLNLSLTVPCRLTAEWNNNKYDTGFIGNYDYNNELVSLGFPEIVSNNYCNYLSINKNLDKPNIIRIKVYTPILESLAKIKIVCANEDLPQFCSEQNLTQKTLYFFSITDASWSNLNNWYTDLTLNIKSNNLPSSDDNVFILSNVLINDLPETPSVNNLTISGNSEITINIIVNGVATFNDNSINNGIILGNAIFNNNSKNQWINKNEFINHINASTTNRLSGKTPSTALPVYLTQDPYKNGVGEFIRNPDCWISGVENISCFSPAQLSGAAWNTRAGTLVTKKHLAFATHFPPAVLPGGTPIIFVDSNNNVVRRNLIRTVIHNMTDITIGLLDQEVPDNIKIAKVLPSDWTNYFDYDSNLYGVGLDQQEKALVKKYQFGYGTRSWYTGYFDESNTLRICMPFVIPCPSNFLYIDNEKTKKLGSVSAKTHYFSEFNETIVAGDSGNPSFLIINNELVFITMWFTAGGGPGFGFFEEEINYINELIFKLSPEEDYSLTTIDLNKAYTKNNYQIYTPINGIIDGTAIFNDSSINYGTIENNATFNTNSYNLGKVKKTINHNTNDMRRSGAAKITSTKPSDHLSPGGDIRGKVSSTSKYVKIVWWDNTTSIEGPANIIFFNSGCNSSNPPCRSFENSYEYQNIKTFDKTESNFLRPGVKNITIYPCDFNGNIAGEITMLDCSNNELISLDVSECVKLEELYCSDNLLTEIDVNGLNLTALSCSSNLLTDLNLNNQTNLKMLYCSSNQLTSLKIDNCLKLTNLNCSINKLTSLNIDDKIMLKSLMFQGNNISNINLNQLTLLDYLDCGINNLLSLNVSNNLLLRNLFMFNNSISSLDLNNNNLLKSLGVGYNPLSTININHLTNLSLLICDNCNLSNIDISNLTNLVRLQCNDNNLSELNIGHNSKLKMLYCENNNLNSLNLSELTSDMEVACDNNNLSVLRGINTKFSYLNASNNNLNTTTINQFFNDIEPHNNGFLIFNNNPGFLTADLSIANSKGYYICGDECN